MANICDYEIRVKGSKNATDIICGSMYPERITYESGNRTNYELHFTGQVKWSVNYDVTDEVEDDELPDIDALKEDSLSALTEEYSGYSLRAKSELFQCEILAHYWSEESGFDQFDHYKNGKCLKKRKIAYDETNEFDWKQTEFVGHVGEYDESVDGEEQDAEYMNQILRILQSL